MQVETVKAQSAAQVAAANVQLKQLDLQIKQLDLEKAKIGVVGDAHGAIMDAHAKVTDQRNAAVTHAQNVTGKLLDLHSQAASAAQAAQPQPAEGGDEPTPAPAASATPAQQGGVDPGMIQSLVAEIAHQRGMIEELMSQVHGPQGGMPPPAAGATIQPGAPLTQ
jgi:hypothetical protein